jgi:hypothetical protein
VATIFDAVTLGASAIYLAAGTHALPTAVTLPAQLVGAGTDSIVDVASGATLRFRSTGGTISHLTIRGGDRLVTVPSAIGGNAIAELRDVRIETSRTAVFVEQAAGPAQVIIDHAHIIGSNTVANAIFTASTVTGSTELRDSTLDEAPVDLIGNTTMRMERCQVRSTSFNRLEPSNAARTVTLVDNQFVQGSSCTTAGVILGGTATLRDNRFTGLSCPDGALRINSSAAAVTFGTPANHFTRNSVDLNVDAAIAIDARGTVFSATNACDRIVLVAGASVMTDDGTCTP